jgi:endo-1,4-beta-xylanase
MRLPNRVMRFLTVTALAVFPFLLVCSSLAVITFFGTHSNPSLRQLAARLGIQIGSAVSADALATDAEYAQIFGQQFSALTPENEMKWASVEAQQGHYTFEQADAEIHFAQQQHQLVRGHNLVWHNQLPSWLTEGTFTNAQLTDLLKQHIFAEAGHFRNEIWQWDVVNEPLNDDGTLRPTIWLNALGPDYIADALRWTHEADPRAKLFLNDYNIEGIGPKSDAMYVLVKSLLAQHIPLDGIGFETHLDLQYNLPPQIKENLQRFAALGLDIAITEMDVRLPLPATADTLATQAEIYTQLMQDCIAIPHCIDFTVWEYTDKYSWIPGFYPGEGAADLYDENLAPKPAAAALVQTLEHSMSR